MSQEIITITLGKKPRRAVLEKWSDGSALRIIGDDDHDPQTEKAAKGPRVFAWDRLGRVEWHQTESQRGR
jgi:hypothetical protein